MSELKYDTEFPLIYIYDVDNPNLVLPEVEDWKPIISEPSCLCVGIMHYVDGYTKVEISNGVLIDTKWHNVFDGKVETPNRILNIGTVENEVISSFRTFSTKINMRVYSDNRKFPNRVIIISDQIEVN